MEVFSHLLQEILERCPSKVKTRENMHFASSVRRSDDALFVQPNTAHSGAALSSVLRLRLTLTPMVSSVLGT